jgi:hypothetical protein
MSRPPPQLALAQRGYRSEPLSAPGHTTEGVAAAHASRAGVIQPLTIGASNCVLAVGMSWQWVLRFARAHGVPIFRVGDRKQLVSAAPLLAALAAHVEAGAQRELSPAEERARMLDALRLEDVS